MDLWIVIVSRNTYARLKVLKLPIFPVNNRKGLLNCILWCTYRTFIAMIFAKYPTQLVIIMHKLAIT